MASFLIFAVLFMSIMPGLASSPPIISDLVVWRQENVAVVSTLGIHLTSKSLYKAVPLRKGKTIGESFCFDEYTGPTSIIYDSSTNCASSNVPSTMTMPNIMVLPSQMSCEKLPENKWKRGECLPADKVEEQEAIHIVPVNDYIVLVCYMLEIAFGNGTIAQCNGVPILLKITDKVKVGDLSFDFEVIYADNQELEPQVGPREFLGVPVEWYLFATLFGTTGVLAVSVFVSYCVFKRLPVGMRARVSIFWGLIEFNGFGYVRLNEDQEALISTSTSNAGNNGEDRYADSPVNTGEDNQSRDYQEIPLIDPNGNSNEIKNETEIKDEDSKNPSSSSPLDGVNNNEEEDTKQINTDSDQTNVSRNSGESFDADGYPPEYVRMNGVILKVNRSLTDHRELKRLGLSGDEILASLASTSHTKTRASNSK